MSSRATMTFNEREEELKRIRQGLYDLASRMRDHFDRTEDDDDELTGYAEQMASALEYALDWSPGHNELPPLDRNTNLTGLVPLMFVTHFPTVMREPVMVIEDGDTEIGTINISSDLLLLNWRGEKAMTYAREVLRAFAVQWDPEGAVMIPRGNRMTEEQQ